MSQSEFNQEKETIHPTNNVPSNSSEESIINQGQKNNDSYTEQKAELINKLTTILQHDIEDIKDEVELIKQSFYKIQRLKNDADKKEFIQNGGKENDFSFSKDELEVELKNLLNEYKERKTTLNAQKESEKEKNLLEKQRILGQMKEIIDHNEDVSSHINEFKNLQQDWKRIGTVPSTSYTELCKTYNSFQEQFWDLVKINNELREYDFKKNLEIKTSLCLSAEALNNDQDIIDASKKLQLLHAEWHETGPVAKECRESIWQRFKEASTVINKKHQTYFEEIRKQEEENLQTKSEICNKIASIDFQTYTNYKDWDEATQHILQLQEDWKKTGHPPRKAQQELFEKYRQACDAFFSAKNQFYKEAKNQQNSNLQQKKALCEKAEAIKNNTDWKSTTEQYIELQKEWKKIGATSKKASDELWKRFNEACDFFFEQKNRNTNVVRTSENENLLKKQEIISKINSLEIGNNTTDVQTQLKALTAAWNEIGHVPFKEKDKTYNAYREAIDLKYKTLKADASKSNMQHFKNNLKNISAKGDEKLYKERDKLIKHYEHLRSEIATYENNICFIKSSSKKGNHLILEMERKIESLKEETKILEQKIILIQENI